MTNVTFRELSAISPLVGFQLSMFDRDFLANFLTFLGVFPQVLHHQCRCRTASRNLAHLKSVSATAAQRLALGGR